MGNACYGKADHPKNGDKHERSVGKGQLGIQSMGAPPVYAPGSPGRAYTKGLDGKRRRVDLRLRVLQPCRAVPGMGGSIEVGIPQYESPEKPGDSVTAQYIQFAQEALRKAQDTDNIQDWDSIKPNKKLIDCAIDVCEQDSMVLVRVQCVLDAPLDEVLKVLERGEGGPKNSNVELLEHPADNVVLMWIEVKVPIVKDREFICAQWIPPPDDTSAKVVRVSLPHEMAEHVRPESKKHVRGRIDLQCTFLSPSPGNPNQCICKWISGVDPGGSLPNVKKMTGTKGAEAILALQKATQAEMKS